MVMTIIRTQKSNFQVNVGVCSTGLTALRGNGQTNELESAICVAYHQGYTAQAVPHQRSRAIQKMTPQRWQQIKDIFQSVVSRDPGERVRLLDRTCAGDQELRHEIERLLESDERAQSFLEVPITPQQDSRTALLERRRIGPYQVVSLLGTGGMGQVYQARDTRLDRTVALKILTPDVAGDEERIKRFTLEAKAASALNHPNVATIYDVGESNGINYIAMEYVEGQTLDQKIERGPMSVIDILTVARQVAGALDMARQNGIVHRDIKPANLIVTTQGQVKVLDFGLAKVSREIVIEGVLPVATTLPGLVMGTVEYMSPEQALGQEVDHRTDIFSLGVVLYQMATGRLPFAGKSITQTIDQILHAEPEPISRFNSKIPLKLQRVIYRCLEKKRERRYPSGRELLADLKESRLAAFFARTVTSPGVRPNWALVFGILSLIGLATLAVTISQPEEKTWRHEYNHSSSRASNSSGTFDTNLKSPPAPLSTPPVDMKSADTSTRLSMVDSRHPKVEKPLASAAVPETQDRVDENRPRVISDDTTNKGVDNDIPTIDDPIFDAFGVAVGRDNAVYVSDGVGGRIYKVLPSGKVLRIAGTGTSGFSGDGGPAISAQLNNPVGLTLDTQGNLYLVDQGNFRIRKITTDGLISTVAGNGGRTTGDDGPAMSARLTRPKSLAFDGGGALYLTDMDRVRKITRNGMISTVFKADPLPGRRPDDLTGVAVDRTGNVFIADNNNFRVFEVKPNGVIRVVAGTGIQGVSGDGGLATSAQLNFPVDVAVDEAGNLFISDDQRIRKVSTDGIINTFPQTSAVYSGGSDVQARGEHINAPLTKGGQLALDGSGNLYVTQPGRRSVLKLTANGNITTALAPYGKSKPVRMGQHSVAVTPISTRASLWADGRTTYTQGTPQIVIENASRIDATVSFNSLLERLPTQCKFAFEISNSDSQKTPELRQEGDGPTLSVTGQLQPGTYNLSLRIHSDLHSPCIAGGTWIPLLLHYLVTVTPY
jgi:serine/threonine protein kinase/sugar lactone lactonase YvrE